MFVNLGRGPSALSSYPKASVTCVLPQAASVCSDNGHKFLRRFKNLRDFIHKRSAVNLWGSPVGA